MLKETVRLKMKMKREETHMALENGCGHLHGSLARKEVKQSIRTLPLPGVWSSSPLTHSERSRFPASTKW